MARATAGGLSLFLALVLVINQGMWLHPPLAGNFYALFPHDTLAWLFGLVFLYAVVALGIGAASFWRMLSPRAPSTRALRAAGLDAAGKALTLKYLDGGHGQECNDEADRHHLRRRVISEALRVGEICVSTLMSRCVPALKKKKII